ncbi:hypothetical protein VTK73DRAFT_8515 [Phialemonium thermophilum]|uniref:Uncharacterized protein n=1 Tax=Phialemonium thermophilum TaxID=223376 RepID=A0ABR3W8A1_9PEZI
MLDTRKSIMLRPRFEDRPCVLPRPSSVSSCVSFFRDRTQSPSVSGFSQPLNHVFSRFDANLGGTSLPLAFWSSSTTSKRLSSLQQGERVGNPQVFISRPLTYTCLIWSCREHNSGGLAQQ